MQLDMIAINMHSDKKLMDVFYHRSTVYHSRAVSRANFTVREYQAAEGCQLWFTQPSLAITKVVRNITQKKFGQIYLGFKNDIHVSTTGEGTNYRLWTRL